MTRIRPLMPRIVAAALAVTTLAGCSASSTPSSPEETSSSTSSPVQPAPANPGGSTQENPGGSEGPGGSDAPSGHSTSPSTSGTTEQPQQQPTLDAGEATESQIAAVREYLAVRENAESVRYDGIDAWKSALKKVTTEHGYGSALHTYGPAPQSNARMVGRRWGYEVKVSVSNCIRPPGASHGNNDNTVTLQCQLTDLVVNKEGTLVPSNAVDHTWPYYGKQESPTVTLAKAGDKWLVDGDYTGQAS